MAASTQQGTPREAGLLELELARRLVLDAVRPLPGEMIELSDALGRVLGEDIAAELPVPAFDGSAMDGYAVRSADTAGAGEASPVPLRVIAESRAGAPAQVDLGVGEAIAISTGAMVPVGADAIVRVEDARPGEGSDEVAVLVAVPAGHDVRHAGDDIRAGQAVLERGSVLGPAELGVLASLGRGSVRCVRRPRLSVLVSGDELLVPGESEKPGGVRDSNSLTISALARRGGAGVVRIGSVGDDAEATVAALSAALEGVDVAVICGGVSVGVHDHVKGALSTLGALEEFWGIALKPGRPTWFGTLGQTLVFGLPGNPVSAMVTFLLLVGPALRALLGMDTEVPRQSAVMERDYAKPPGRAHAVRCRLSAHEDGWHVDPTGPQGSHVLTSMLGADALAILPSAVELVRAGERVEIEPLRRWAGGLG
jgi:molybdopterin molybdotransferase